jgi:hypothetical protein
LLLAFTGNRQQDLFWLGGKWRGFVHFGIFFLPEDHAE